MITDRKNEDVTVTRKLGNGSSVTYKSPQGSQMSLDHILNGMSDNYQMGGAVRGYAPSPVADNMKINVTPGEYVMNQPATMKYKPVLDQMNQDGRQMLAQGGWVDQAKPMGYARGGGVGAVKYWDPMQMKYVWGTKEQAAQAASQSSLPQVAPTQPPVRGNKIRWDNGQAVPFDENEVVTPTGDVVPESTPEVTTPDITIPDSVGPEGNPEQGTKQSVLPHDDVIHSVTPKQVEVKIGNKTDVKLKKSASKLIGDATGVASLLANLQTAIDKETNKRDGMKLMTFGLSMLAGEGIDSSIDAANSVGSFNKEKLDALWDQRNEIQDRVTEKTLTEVGFPGETSTGTGGGKGGSGVFATSVKGDDGLVYEHHKDGSYTNASTGEPKPANVKIISTVGPLPASTTKEIRKLTDQASSDFTDSRKIDDLVDNINEYGGVEGFVTGGFTEWVKGAFGWEGGATSWRTEFTGLKNKLAIAGLPPGVASDRDISIIMAGFPSATWDKPTLKRWLRGYQKALRISSVKDNAEAKWVKSHGDAVGFLDYWKENAQKLASKDGVSFIPRTAAQIANDERLFRGGDTNVGTTSSGRNWHIVR